MADKSDLQNQFITLTGADEERAKFFLESTKWDLNLALATYYDNDDGDDGMVLPPTTGGTDQPQHSISSQTAGSGGGSTAANSRVTDLGSLLRRGLRADDDGSSSEEEGQAFFAGGSETSGQQILGPPKKKKDKNVVENIFKSAKDHGAEEVSMEEARRKQKRGRQGNAFRGTGYRLGETAEEEVETIEDETRDTHPMTVDLTFWENGFSIDDGELKDFRKEENQPFLKAVQKGEIPPELMSKAHGREVHVNMIDKRTEEYLKKKHSAKAFTGSGHMLGSPSPNVLSTPTSAPAPPSSDCPPAPTVDINPDQPVTQLQIRLANGQRLVAKFNQSHNVQDVRRHILACHPEYSDRTFVLMTTFPNKELTDDLQTLESAKLINTVVVQRLK